MENNSLNLDMANKCQICGHDENKHGKGRRNGREGFNCKLMVRVDKWNKEICGCKKFTIEVLNEHEKSNVSHNEY